MSPPHFALFLLFCTLGGMNFVVAKIGVDAIPPLFVVAMRFAMLSAVLFPLFKWRGWKMARAIVPAALMTGGVNFGIMFLGIKLSNASVSAVVVQLSIPMAVILSIIFLKEQVGWRRWLGVALTFSGVVIIGFDPEIVDYKLGVFVVICAAFTGAVGNILLRRLKDVQPLEMQAWVGIISAPLLLAATFVFESGQIEAVRAAPWLALGVVAYSALGVSLVGHGIRFYIVQRYDVSVVAPLMAIAPTIGVIAGIVMLGEPVTAQIILGSLLVITGVVIISRRQAKKVPDAPLAPTDGGTMPAVGLRAGEKPPFKEAAKK